MRKPVVFHNRMIRAVLSLMTFVLLGALLMPGLQSHADTPDLLPELKGDTQDKMILVDFYSQFCQTCMMMAPHVAALEERLADKLTVKRVDVSLPENEHYLKTYQFETTPAYILFNPKGKALYRMNELINPAILERQVLRTLNALEQIDFPEEFHLPIPDGSAKQSVNGVILVAFDNPDCDSCKEMTPYLNGFLMTGQEGFHLLRVDTASPGGAQLMKSLSIPRLPAYVLFDNNQGDAGKRGELFRVVGNIPPKALWELVRVFSESGV